MLVLSGICSYSCYVLRIANLFVEWGLGRSANKSCTLERCVQTSQMESYWMVAFSKKIGVSP
jgi:hypothetical protein